MKVQATARVRVVLDIPVSDSWGDGCDIAQINKQARESAIGALRTRHPESPTASGLINGATIVGEPEVTAILVSRDDR